MGTIADLISIFSRCTIPLPNMVSDHPDFDQSCWIVAASFFAMSYIKVARYLSERTTLVAAEHLLPGRNNVVFRRKKSSIAASHLIKFRISHLAVSKQNVVGEDFFVDYRRYYMFPNTT